MKKLTEIQKSFIMYAFFENPNFAGWRNIAERLLDTGECIVPGDRCIWNAGIGNFIKTSDTPDAYNCLLYEFDLESFLNCDWFKENLEQRIDRAEVEFNRVNRYYNELREFYEKE